MNQEILDEITNQDYQKIKESIESTLETKLAETDCDGIIFGLSGGIDSATVACLCSNVLKNKSLALVMPDSQISPNDETEDALQLVKKLGLEYKLIDINLIHNQYSKILEPNDLALGNLRARIRANILYYYANAKNFLVVGYGWVGKGVASACSGLNAKVTITEVDPIKALEAHMDAYDVMPMSEAAKIGDIFITCTGMTGVIRKEHLLKMKDGAVVGNVGHFDVEIDAQYLLKKSKSVKQVRPSLDECVLKNGKKIYLIGKGRIANLVAAEGHPPEVMAQSFSNQLLSILYILKNHKKMDKKVIPVPKEIDIQVAIDALKAMDVKIDKLNKEQVAYMNSWN